MGDIGFLQCPAKTISLCFTSSVLRVAYITGGIKAIMYAFNMTPQPGCSLCGLAEDHSHVLKHCLYPSLTFSVIPRMWDAVVHDNTWVEPSCICLDHNMLC